MRWHRVGFRCYWRWKSCPARHSGKRKSLRRTSWVNACLPTSAVSSQNSVEAFRGSCPHWQMIELRVAAMRGVRVAHRRQLGNLWGPRIIATDRQAPRIYPRMIRLCSRFDSVLYTPKISEIPSYGNYSRSPYVSRRAVQTRGGRLRPLNRTMHQISASLFIVARKLRLRVPTRVVPNIFAIPGKSVRKPAGDFLSRE